MDLQLFNGERTEEATPRKLQKARKEGRFPRSTDLTAGLGLVAAAMALRAWGPSLYEQLAGGMTQTLSGLQRTELTPGTLQGILQDWVLVYLKGVLPLAGVLAALGAGAGLAQSRLHFSLSHLSPDFTRIDPFSGLARLFSGKTFVELVHTLLKVTLVGYIAYREVAGALPQVTQQLGQNVALGVSLVADRALSALQMIGFGLLALGVLEYGYRIYEFRQSLKMTKQEVKQELKEQENPEVKQKQRSRQREMARRRKALKDVPEADVVITNPTHFAVAIQYRSDETAAPKVIAKGADLLAQRIKVVAKEHDVPLVENRPLARTLYATVDVGKTVPPELYQAVAEVLAFVYELRRQERRGYRPPFDPRNLPG